MIFTAKPIDDWLYNNRINKTEAAKMLNLAPQTVSPLLKASNMSVKNLIKLLKLTNFEVKFEDCLVKNNGKEAA